ASLPWAYALGITGLIAAVSLAAGKGPDWLRRACAFVAWALVCSLQVRNPMTVAGGDQLLKLLLFWQIFLPLRAAVVGLTLQLAMMYVFAGLEKLNPAWIDSGVALVFTMRM